MVSQGYSPQAQRMYRKYILRPLVILFLISLSLVLLSRLDLAGAPLLSISGWISYPLTGLFSLLVVYSLSMELFEWIRAKHSWKRLGRKAVYRLEFGEGGIIFDASRLTPKPRWTDLSQYKTTDRLYALSKDRVWLAIPKRVFHSEEQEERFWDIVEWLLPPGTTVGPELLDRWAESKSPPIKQVRLVSFNGIGTFLRSWKHYPDGTSEATVWACLLYLPLFPLKKCRLRVLSGPDSEPHISLTQLILGVLNPHDAIKDSYELIERCRIEPREVLNTYLYTYIRMPLILFVPLCLVILCLKCAVWLFADGSVIPAIVGAALTLAWFGFLLAMLAQELHKSRGGRV